MAAFVFAVIDFLTEKERENQQIRRVETHCHKGVKALYKCITIRILFETTVITFGGFAMTISRHFGRLTFCLYVDESHLHRGDEI